MDLFKDLDYGEVRTQRTHTLSINVKNDEVDIASGNSTSSSVRVLNNKSWGFASSHGSLNVMSLMENAKKMSRLSSGDVDININAGGSGLDFGNKIELDTDAIVQDVKDGLKVVDDKRLKYRGVAYIIKYIEKEYYNSLDDEFRSSGYVSYAKSRVILSDGLSSSEGIEVIGGLKSRLDYEPVIAKSYDYAKKTMKAEKIKPGKYTTILDNDLTGTFCHEVVGHASEADGVVLKDSIFSGKLGEKVSHDYVNIIDDPSIREFGYFKIDDEGVKAKRVDIIKNGVLNDFMNSRETSQKLKLKSNGHARAESGADVPIVRMSNTYMLPGNAKKEDVFDVSDGVYLMGMRGGSVEPYTGQFMFAAKLGYIVKNGEFVKPVRDVTLSGDLLSVLKNINIVGNDGKFNPGWCGKSGQSVRVADGGPHIQVKGMRIS